MDFVIDSIAIGDGVEAEDEELLLRLGITHVLNVHPMKMEYKKIKYTQIPWHDEKNIDRLNEALSYIHKTLKDGGKIIVICGGGVERSPLTVFAYLHKKSGLSIKDALHLIESKRPQSDIHLDWLGDWLNLSREESIMFRPYFWL